MVEFLSTHVLAKEDSHVVTVDLAMRVFVNQTEDRQDGVVEATDKLLLEQFDFLQALDLPIDQNTKAEAVLVSLEALVSQVTRCEISFFEV